MQCRVANIKDVVDRQLCCGCGACAYVAPKHFVMHDVTDLGRRPVALTLNGRGTVQEQGAVENALKVCPGRTLAHDFDENDPVLLKDLREDWGPVIEVWEGYAADPELRASASSGGALTALAQFCLEHGGMHGVLHTAAREDAPWLNRSVLSRTTEELRAQVGSRYAPASPCDSLDLIEHAEAPCVFVGKPCDVAGARAAARLRPGLADNLGLTIAFFCAGTPSTRGTLELLRRHGIDDTSRIRSVRYRGNGWPGRWTVKHLDDAGMEIESSLSYEDSWGFLQRYRQWRCYICPDHTGEFADLAVGDPWYRQPEPKEPGRSLIVARTRRGLETLRSAAEAGFITLERQDASLLPRSQPNLLMTRGRLWGQLRTLRLSGVASPTYRGFPMFRAWWSVLSLRSKIQSFAGTLKRIVVKRLHRRVDATPTVDASSSATLVSTIS